MRLIFRWIRACWELAIFMWPKRDPDPLGTLLSQHRFLLGLKQVQQDDDSWLDAEIARVERQIERLRAHPRP